MQHYVNFPPTDGGYPELIREYIDAQIKRNHDLIEFMCEQSLVIPGDYGVLVTELEGGSIKVQLSKDVPFGEIHTIQHQATVVDFAPRPAKCIHGNNLLVCGCGREQGRG